MSDHNKQPPSSDSFRGLETYNTPVGPVSTFDFKELMFTVVATPYEHRVEFLIYDIMGIREDGKVLWKRKDSQFGDPVESLADAEIYIYGSVKWDGCSNWHFEEQERVMLHGCSRKDIERYGIVLATCWDIAGGLCPAWGQDDTGWPKANYPRVEEP